MGSRRKKCYEDEKKDKNKKNMVLGDRYGLFWKKSIGNFDDNKVEYIA